MRESLNSRCGAVQMRPYLSRVTLALTQGLVKNRKFDLWPFAFSICS